MGRNKQGYIKVTCENCGHVQWVRRKDMRNGCFCKKCGELLYRR